jgi:hypothetical protein
MNQISAIFEIYKTKSEQYLNANGRNWREPDKQGADDMAIHDTVLIAVTFCMFNLYVGGREPSGSISPFSQRGNVRRQLFAAWSKPRETGETARGLSPSPCEAVDPELRPAPQAARSGGRPWHHARQRTRPPGVPDSQTSGSQTRS